MIKTHTHATQCRFAECCARRSTSFGGGSVASSTHTHIAAAYPSPRRFAASGAEASTRPCAGTFADRVRAPAPSTSRAPSRLARFCFSFSLSSEDDSDEDATIEKHVSFVLFLFDDDDDALLLMKILLPVGFCSRLEDDDRIIHLFSFFEEESKEEEEPTADTKAALLLIKEDIVFAFALAIVSVSYTHLTLPTKA